MKRTIIALMTGVLLMPGLALADTSGSNQASTTPQQRSCVQAAIAVRENAHLTALDALFASFKTAYIARKNALVSAWDNADSKVRNAAIKSANVTFAASIKTSWSTFRTARANAATTYKASVTSCGLTSSSNKSANDDRSDDDHGKKESKDHKGSLSAKLRLNLGAFRN